ncbi:MAG: asparagine synthase (glutamine-hydrolyzing) [Planctomycetota bacterium]
MCGISGIYFADRTRTVDVADLRAMAQAMAHRGPDGDGIATGSGFGFTHRRLSIVDIASGQQPMTTADGALTVTFNGEIYNYLELRQELAAHGAVFRTNSDTEVLLHGYRAWGTDLASRLRGMFAFAIVDRKSHELYCARDRMGKKPLHWTQHDGRFAFASEIKSLLALGIDRTLSPTAIGQFFALRYVPDPISVFANVHKLPPAHWCVVRGDSVRTVRYWDIPFDEVDDRPEATQHEEALRLLDESTSIRLMGEVPLAPFLSGGIDSYAVVDSMIRTQGRGVRACTIGFDDPAFDEREGARQSAKACGAELVEEELSIAAMTQIDWLADTFDEPFADSSAVPTYHVSRLARKHVTVALSGDGGDENFCGYRRYVFDWRENQFRGLLPRGAWALAARIAPKGDWLPRPLRWRRTLQNLATDPALAYARSVSANLPEEVFAVLRTDLRPSLGDPLGPVLDAYRRGEGRDPLQRATAADFATWLPGDILVKVDRTSMATALEVRAPFLDQKMVEFAARIPTARKLQGAETKVFLRRALAKRLDPAALSRRKQGFSVPLRKWLQGGVGDLLVQELDGRLLRDWVDPDVVRAMLARHRSGVRDHSEMLWAVLMFARFLRRWCA